ncbi:MAG TPA: M48 family metalloprotease [Candidatus Angelobacter sp.]|jgi:WD40 repeat protein|nr:M48 family metalloprotease [Candidatus Angelobacter sp.]
MTFALRSFFLLLAVLAATCHHCFAQQPAAAAPCAMPVFSNVVHDPNIFSEQQEEWLGEILDPQIRKEFNVIDDPENDYLQKIGERLLAQLPPTKIHYSFTIIDAPESDSFGLAGGHIYLSRKIIALIQSEDELAGLLGHEIGHIITHQVAIDISRDFRNVLGVTQVGDRKDIVDRWNQLLDTFAKHPQKHDEKREQQEQLIADRLALYAMTRAGYKTSSFGDFFDRLAGTKKNTGNFWSDFFGATSPESKRLRELMRTSAPLAPVCITAPPSDAAVHFPKWQQAVIASKRAVAKEEIPGLIRKTSLKPPLRGELDQLQFSPDGKYLFGQDESSVFVLTREPLANLFRIDAPDAKAAHFTPDSLAIVFYDKELRIEKWEIASQQRTSIRQLTSKCFDTDLSPTGEVLACVTPDLDLQLVDVTSGKPVFSKQKFYQPTFADLIMLELARILDEADATPNLFSTRFSPDGHYFVISRGEMQFAYDLQTRSEVKLPKKVKEILTSFTFLDSGQLIGHSAKSNKLTIVRFPSGDLVDEFPFNFGGNYSRVQKGNYLLIRPAGNAAVGVIDLAGKKASMGYKAPGFAIYDTVFAGEELGGEVSLYTLADRKQLAKVQLPDSPLSAARVSSFSANGKWLAVSGRSRAAVWKLETGERALYLRDLAGAFFDQDQFIARFPKREKDPSTVFEFDPSNKQSKKLYEIAAEPEDVLPDALARFVGRPIFQFGDLMVSVKPDDAKKSTNNYVVEARDLRTNKPLWEHKFEKERPSFHYSPAGKTMSTVIANYDAIQQQAKSDPGLAAKLKALGGGQDKKASYVVQVTEALTGKTLGEVLVDTGKLSFKVKSAIAAGDTVLVTDSENRTLVYSLKSGEQIGKVFGRSQALSVRGDRMLVENGKGNVDLYDTATLQSLAHFSLPSLIGQAAFSTDGNSLYILTIDQNVYNVAVH